MQENKRRQQKTELAALIAETTRNKGPDASQDEENISTPMVPSKESMRMIARITIQYRKNPIQPK